jgi:quinol monooxygenase YgiN
MIYVEVNFSVARGNRDAAVACLTKEAPQMCALAGNRACRVLTDPNDPCAVTLLHQWDDLACLDRYRGGSLFAAVGVMLRPMMTWAPSTAVYDATLMD